MPHTTRVDVTTKQIKGMSLGDKVTITLEGKISELTAERSFDDGPAIPGGKKAKKETFPPEITVEVSKTSVRNGSNQFDELAD
jgi:hypothetical protein